MKILVVDDNDVCATLLQFTLTEGGHEVLVASSGEEALDAVRTQNVRMVISDWEMPGMSGTELCRAVRAEQTSHYVYLVLLTSHDLPEERVEGLASGADDFVAKPFNPEELIERVRVAERILSLETRDVAIFAMAKLAESRDPETGAHLERVQSYARALAQRLACVKDFERQVDAEFIRMIHLTSPLHDIGKVGIPDSVLLKAGRFTDDEFKVMKTHTLIGAKTLDAALATFPGVQFLEMARDIALTHHERWDGGGYPNGLKSDDIPLCGRIVALADVYDALTAKRVYKPAFSHEVARDMIVGESGKHFDPRIVQAFRDVEQTFIAILERFREDSHHSDATAKAA